MKSILIFIVLFAVNSLWAASLDQGLAMMNERLDNFNALLNNRDLDAESKRAQLAQIVENSVDFKAIGQKVLEPYVSTLSTEQSERFYAAFKTTLKDWVLDDLMRFKDEKITLSEYVWLPDEERVLVKTLGRKKAELSTTDRYMKRAHTEYVLQAKDGKWVIVDMTINRVNIALNYRSQIEALMNRGKSSEKMVQLFEEIAISK